VTTLYFILYLLAAVCFLAAAASVALNRVNILALGLLFWVLVPLIVTARAL
jgi:hypothetical protein